MNENFNVSIPYLQMVIFQLKKPDFFSFITFESLFLKKAVKIRDSKFGVALVIETLPTVIHKKNLFLITKIDRIMIYRYFDLIKGRKLRSRLQDRPGRQTKRHTERDQQLVQGLQWLANIRRRF